MEKGKIKKNRKIKLHFVLCFFICSIVGMAQSKNGIDKNKVEDEAVKIDIIINKNDAGYDDIENSNDNTEEIGEEGDLIFLDQIQDEEEEKTKKKLEKVSKIERFIQKIDEKVNPTIKFQIAKSYGTWYLLKTDDYSEAELENIRYDFVQQQNGYQIIKSYFNPKFNVWSEDKQRAWIEEKKGFVYLRIEKKYFKNNKNEILFFDKNYRYMIIKYENGIMRVLSRYPNNEKISLEGEELAEFNKILESRDTLKNVFYDVKIKSIKEIEEERKKAEFKQKNEELEKALNENPMNVFQIDTIGAKKEMERRAKAQEMKAKSDVKNMEIIEIKNENNNENQTNENQQMKK